MFKHSYLRFTICYQTGNARDSHLIHPHCCQPNSWSTR